MKRVTGHLRLGVILASLALIITPAVVNAGPANNKAAASTTVTYTHSSVTAGTVSPDTVTYHYVCDNSFFCWQSNGIDFVIYLKTITNTKLRLANCGAWTYNGNNACQYETPSGNCVQSNVGSYDTIEPCNANNSYQFYWYTGSDALLSEGASIYQGSAWCELDNYSAGDGYGAIQNAPCPSPTNQPSWMTFFYETP